MTEAANNDYRQTLRKQLRKRRRAISADERQQVSETMAGHLSQYSPWQRSQHVGLYLATPEEAPTSDLTSLCLSAGKTTYLPVVATNDSQQDAMLFGRFMPGETPMRKNRFGIDEPVPDEGTVIRGVELDFVCVPLVGFNLKGDRIGMGAGFYDRTFEKVSSGTTHLLGISFSCQQADFDASPHDVAMHAILTEHGIIELNQSVGAETGH